MKFKYVISYNNTYLYSALFTLCSNALLKNTVIPYMTELSATILELIYENNKDSVTQKNQPVN